LSALSLRLPPPDPAFRWTDGAWGPVLRCTPLEAIAQHAFTSRQPRLPVESVGAPPDAWEIAAQSVGAPLDRVARVKQVHSRKVRALLRDRVTPQAVRRRPEGDAIVSNQAGLALSVSVADCVPILIADARRGAAAAVHAGWRGTCNLVVARAIERMTEEFHTNPGDCTAAIGPSIGPDDYEVGKELVDAYLAAGYSRADVDRWFRRAEGKLTLDLWTANRDQLIASFVPPASIFVCRLSTLAHPQVFESYRVEGPQAGRMAALIVVPPQAAQPR
jgi:purine-nucleoside/S-methyl-5'-thioadenosine phosphorylase / adenosine deaminase